MFKINRNEITRKQTLLKPGLADFGKPVDLHILLSFILGQG